MMVLHGDRGSGKSSIIANWLQKFGAENREVKVINHYVGCSGRSVDLSIFLRKAIKELREEFSGKCQGRFPLCCLTLTSQYTTCDNQGTVRGILR